MAVDPRAVSVFVVAEVHGEVLGRFTMCKYHVSSSVARSGSGIGIPGTRLEPASLSLCAAWFDIVVVLVSLDATLHVPVV